MFSSNTAFGDLLKLLKLEIFHHHVIKFVLHLLLSFDLCFSSIVKFKSQLFLLDLSKCFIIFDFDLPIYGIFPII